VQLKEIEESWFRRWAEEGRERLASLWFRSIISPAAPPGGEVTSLTWMDWFALMEAVCNGNEGTPHARKDLA